MKLLKSSLFTLVGTLLIAGVTAHALEKGDAAPCVILDHVQKGMDSSHCIREPQVEGRPVFIEFFSITCSDCMKNLPNILKLAQDLEGKATVRLVSVDRDEKKVRTYIEKNQINLEVAFDVNRDARKAYGVSVTPTLFLLDQNNNIADKHIGILSQEDLNNLIAKSEEL